MRGSSRLVVSGVAAVAAATFLTSGGAVAAPAPTVVAEGLNGPFQLAHDRGGALLVTESDIGQITRIEPRTGSKTPVVTGVPGASGAIRFGKYVAIITGGAEDPDNPPTVSGSSLFLAKPGGTPVKVADLLAYELKNNPDGQTQFDPTTGQPSDSLSNPFNIIEDRTHRGTFIIADAGANAVLRVRLQAKHGHPGHHGHHGHGKHGHKHHTGFRATITTLFVPPVVRDGACATAENNTPDGFGCDPVPTGLAYGPGGLLYVSTLGAESPGAGRVYAISPWTGKVAKVITGLDSPTGIAVSPRGTIYVSDVLEGAPEGDPGPGFDPATVGQITRIDRHGGRSVAQVTMPTGLLWRHGSLYSSAWSIASFLGIHDAGQVVRVPESAFVPTT